MPRKRTKGAGMERNAGARADQTSPPKRVRDTPIQRGGGTRGPSAVDKRAAEVAGVTKAKPMLESQRHMVLGKSKTSGNPIGNATRKRT